MWHTFSIFSDKNSALIYEYCGHSLIGNHQKTENTVNICLLNLPTLYLGCPPVESPTAEERFAIETVMVASIIAGVVAFVFFVLGVISCLFKKLK